MPDSFNCPHCGAKLRGRLDGRERKCPKCQTTIAADDFLRGAVPEPPPPAAPSALNPLLFLAAAGVFQILSLIFLTGSGRSLPIVLGSAAIACLIAAVISVKHDRDSALVNVQHAVEAHHAARKIDSLYTGLQQQFDVVFQRHCDEVTKEFNDHLETANQELERQQHELTAEAERLESRSESLRGREADVDEIVQRLGKRFLSDSVRFISQKLNANNFTAQRERLVKVVEFCRRHRYEVPVDDEQELVRDLRQRFEDVVRKQFLREEQARIKEQIREEERVQAQYEKELKELDRQTKAIEKALAKALRETDDEHSAQVEELRERLAEAEERAQRTKSMAELGVKAGHVYVLSNIGSFGEDVFKVGMSRRLNPEERVKELSSASVPFPFDVHMMISCDNAPELENQLHKALDSYRVNRVNLRKEFFHVDLDTIHELVVTSQGEVDYIAEPEALQYHETIEMDDDEYEMLHRVLTGVEKEMGG